jgi:hypothetical protein
MPILDDQPRRVRNVILQEPHGEFDVTLERGIRDPLVLERHRLA